MRKADVPQAVDQVAGRDHREIGSSAYLLSYPRYTGCHAVASVASVES